MGSVTAAIKALAEQWRSEASEQEPANGSDYSLAMAAALRQAADELEALPSEPVKTQGAKGDPSSSLVPVLTEEDQDLFKVAATCIDLVRNDLPPDISEWECSLAYHRLRELADRKPSEESAK